MERKQFLIYVTTATGLLPLSITQIGCAYNASGTEGSTEGFKVLSSRVNFHRHEIMILFADVSQPPASGKTITSSGPIHTHDVILGMADYQALHGVELGYRAAPTPQVLTSIPPVRLDNTESNS